MSGSVAIVSWERANARSRLKPKASLTCLCGNALSPAGCWRRAWTWDKVPKNIVAIALATIF
ncbi:hypothetical protein [Microcoleus sp. bin38.metabat.b11b12b14.051]|uniref:hypothetical protein n=1 Tax=Microcoleus sp. bin38.metabat.b11b12b14.051 TaxID=2742709 RepID=UPI0026005016|nr:hypothetical protein [Microcoleus sp. bin38.metabat.b11b12b14.051]